MHQAGFFPMFSRWIGLSEWCAALPLSVLVRLGFWPPNPRVCVEFRAFSRAQELPQPLLRMGCGGRAAPVSFLRFAKKKRRAGVAETVELPKRRASVLLRQS